MEEKLRRARASGIKVSALWCQDWQGIRMTPYGKQLFWNWRYDESLYPDLPVSSRNFIGWASSSWGTSTPTSPVMEPSTGEGGARVLRQGSGERRGVHHALHHL